MMDSTATFPRSHDAHITRSYWRWPSGVGVFVKSLHLLAAAWLATVALLWMAVEPNQPAGGNILAHALIPALLIEALVFGIDQWTKTLGGSTYPRAHEWEHALVWAIVPTTFLIGTALLLIG